MPGMKSKVAGLLLGLAAMGAAMPNEANQIMRGTAPLNGKWKRAHRENVKRKRLRRISNKSRSLNRR
jgi:hypothetical protein